MDYRPAYFGFICPAHQSESAGFLSPPLKIFLTPSLVIYTWPLHKSTCRFIHIRIHETFPPFLPPSFYLLRYTLLVAALHAAASAAAVSDSSSPPSTTPPLLLSLPSFLPHFPPPRGPSPAPSPPGPLTREPPGRDGGIYVFRRTSSCPALLPARASLEIGPGSFHLPGLGSVRLWVGGKREGGREEDIR